MILHELIDYQTLRLIWWLLLGILVIGFAVMDGFDLGVATLFRWLGRDDDKRPVTVTACWYEVCTLPVSGEMFSGKRLVYVERNLLRLR